MRSLSAVFAFIAFLNPRLALATVYLPADFSEMVSTSVFIVHGTVSDVRSEAISDRRSIVTFVTVDVADPLKGKPGESLTFFVPGGQAGRYERVVVGAPRFERGDEVVLFLAARGPSIPYVFGLSQGVYRVSRRTGQPMVVPTAILSRGADARETQPIVRGDPARRPLALSDFAREVRAAMERAK